MPLITIQRPNDHGQASWHWRLQNNALVKDVSDRKIRIWWFTIHFKHGNFCRFWRCCKINFMITSIKIVEGGNEVRVGTILFGERDYSKKKTEEA